MFELKKGKEAFTMVEGPFGGRKFEPGKSYDEIPPGMAGNFTEIKKAAAPVREAAKPAKVADSKEEGVSNPPSEKGRK